VAQDCAPLYEEVAAMNDARRGVILLDVSPGEAEVFDAAFLERTGHPVVVCHGPGTELCPLLGGEACSKFADAHGIVFQLDLDRPQHRDIVMRYRALTRPELPIRVVVGPGQAERYPELLSEVEVWAHEPTAADLDGFAARVEAADRDDVDAEQDL
jgi:hypothetical protein